MMHRPRVFLVAWALIVAYETVWALWAAFTGHWLDALSFGIWATIALGMLVLPARAYRTGWLGGRLALMESMAEAQKRGMTAADWLAAEAERDGIPIRRLPVEPDE